MTEKAQKTVHIKWVRSGIGFTRRQKEMVRSLGLGRLNQVVERPDTAPIRGLVENIPHLVQVVSKPAKPEWMSVPEYTIYPPEVSAEVPAPPPRAKAAPAPVAKADVHAETAKPAAKESKAEAEKAAAESGQAAKAKKPAKPAAGKAKPAKPGESKKTKAADKAKPAKKTKK